ncbi:MAG: flagellar motor protein MotB [Zetaproteobacteria bacterium CG_4_9_14_3_um_filter_49_83]|nr:MAG: flagellar motor protein MotB [Zetaproteobacteria bacterium CG1_02_49_23]PIQ30703.1 MAG: flagellar motor protein MotB [Zetaproteobacteria bacterium CG17_big_fil_post_rev_8_21_14_2_50_50_13]PIV30915.1 MAG: flagellar motor protein MotB [Zetaproteobacteria bacterium CG02_land_8_20_14_3_00_50_9]PIY57194.1 MAG: flagellar motor protein MotB [Zetaproteobacteria bacterium CG_4_10_14_0_8_um_filter_49_80]PJA34469.1 MAG: flagellar motor protein MotB [Zetaproteobacteria bacterium CG_4_9_14_3_um_filt
MAVVVLTSGMLLSGCISANDPNKHTKQNAGIGAAVGAAAGAIIGYQKDHSGGALRGALIGAAAGGALGAGTGMYMDKQQAEFERQLASERQANQIEVERLKNENLKITMNSEVSFDFNSSELKPAFSKTLNKVGEILQRYPRTTIKVIGFTDSVGSSQYNQRLSQERANAVAWYLEDQGIAPRRVIAEGRGESDPRASNDSEAGRQLNRRVELLIVPDEGIE